MLKKEGSKLKENTHHRFPRGIMRRVKHLPSTPFAQRVVNVVAPNRADQGILCLLGFMRNQHSLSFVHRPFLLCKFFTRPRRQEDIS